MEKLHILLTPNKEHKKVFPNVPVIGFLNGKGLEDFLVRATLAKLNESRRCKPCGKKTCLVCNSINTAMAFTTEACQETFKIQSGPLTSDSKKVLFLLNCKVCAKVQLNHLVSLAKWLSVHLQTKWLWVQVPLQSLKLQILRLFQAMSSLTFRQL